MRRSKDVVSCTNNLRVNLFATQSAAIGSPELRQQHALKATDLVTAPAAPIGSTPEEQGFVDWLKAQVLASPGRRTLSGRKQIEEGMTKFSLSERRAGRLRANALELFGTSAWRKAGRPRGRNYEDAGK